MVVTIIIYLLIGFIASLIYYAYECYMFKKNKFKDWKIYTDRSNIETNMGIVMLSWPAFLILSVYIGLTYYPMKYIKNLFKIK